MEEKERYEIHRYTLQGNEKISFNDHAEHICEHYDFGFEKIKPFNQRIQDLLNQQDKRIKDLETELENYKLCRCVNCSNEYEYSLETSIDELEKEIKQLKQSQKQLAISELEKIKKCCEKFAEELCDNLVDVVLLTDVDKPRREAMKYLYLVSEFIDDQIKELGRRE